MKIKSFNTISLCLVLFTVLSLGCEKQLAINHNPSFPAEAEGTPAIVFPAAVLATTAKVGGDLAIVGDLWSQYCTQAALAQQYTDVDSYQMTNTDGFVSGGNSSWSILYTTGLKNYQYVINQAKANSDWNYYLAATVMKAYTMEVLADLYDKAPYTEALLGAANLQPKFDSGIIIYQGLLNELDTALSKDFSAPTNSSLGTSDLVFGGTMSGWIQFAYTLELKMYLRMVNAQPNTAQTGITALYALNPSFLASDAAVTNFSDAAGLDNPMFEQNFRSLNTSANLRASTTFVSWLEANNDSRILSLFDSSNSSVTGIYPSTTGQPGSVNQGDYRNSSDPAYQTAPIFGESATDPVEFISGAESYFMQAEADLRYFGGTNAQTLYNQGVLAAFASYGLDGSSYIAPGAVYAYPTSGTMDQQIQAIITQKWASCAYGCHGIEAFFEKNRTGYPLTSSVYSTDPNYVPGQLVISMNTVLPAGELPERFVYPYDESSKNPNTPAQVPITTGVWWAK